MKRKGISIKWDGLCDEYLWFSVSSETNPDADPYVVTIGITAENQGLMECTCPDAVCRHKEGGISSVGGHDCKHMRAVKAALKENERTI